MHQVVKMSTISFNNTTRSIRDILQSKQSGRLITPAHQRYADIWTLAKKQKFIDTCKTGLPFPTILIHEGDEGVSSIEDGLQRTSTLMAFVNDEFNDAAGQKFTHWSPIDQALFMNYPVPVLSFRNATQLQRIEIFDRFQNGCPLETGERIHAHSHTMLVSSTIKLLLTPGVGLHDRAVKVWGPIIKKTKKDKRYSYLLNNVALVNGAAHGFTDGTSGITKHFESLSDNFNLAIDEALVVRVLEEVFSIYEEVDRLHPNAGKKILATQAGIGNFTGYIVYSLKTCPLLWAKLHAGWVAFLLSYRKDINLLKNRMHKDRPSSRNWNVNLWKSGCHNIFPEINAFKGVKPKEDEDDDSIEE